MIVVSKKLKAAIKLGDQPAYQIAHKANLDPSTLSKLLCGISKIRENDARLIAVGHVLGLPPEECFQEEAD